MRRMLATLLAAAVMVPAVQARTDAVEVDPADWPRYARALGGTPIILHQYVRNCDAAIKRAADAGATVVMPAQDMFWGDRYGMVRDPFGHEWSFATPLAQKKA